jgi:hypothetical protein
MRLSIYFLEEVATTIQVYQAVLGNVHVLLATFNYPQAEPVKYAGSTSTDWESTISTVFDVCLPAGTYSVVFVANAVCNTTTCSNPFFFLLSFNAIEHSDVCSTPVYRNSSAGIEQFHVV